jgi:hypothetical protein
MSDPDVSRVGQSRRAAHVLHGKSRLESIQDLVEESRGILINDNQLKVAIGLAIERLKQFYERSDSANRSNDQGKFSHKPSQRIFLCNKKIQLETIRAAAQDGSIP